ncbi:hypothetical protein SAMN05216268_105237 [Streptomyces yunnanensis]|uniref:Uncharacterized protein n=1 Tax=Streptomyces yunnanensis TaxID=156453 RepID=A0A9X8MS85_9ACTN|nr:hypothetical protein SAMN05216268_105237 [Streptomyces yunnanensis]
MSEWINPQRAATVAAYRKIVDASSHPRRPRSKWGRQRPRRCSGCVMVVDPATGTPYTVVCSCPIRPA